MMKILKSIINQFKVERVPIGKNTLGLWGDMDDVDLIEDIEASFGIEFPRDKPVEWSTVQDIYEDLKQHYLQGRTEPPGCTSQKSFYKIRQCLGRVAPGNPVNTDRLLIDIKGVSVRKFYAVLNREYGLRTPTPVLSWVGILGVVIIVSGCAAAFAFDGWLAPLAVALGPGLCGLLMVMFGKIRYPRECQTIGDFARKVAALNFSQLKGGSGRIRGGELWDALLEVLVDHTLLRRSEIRPDTSILQS